MATDLMRSAALAGLLALLSAPTFASSEPPFAFKPDTGNEASLQKGARSYMNYCSGCHSLKYLRYNRLGKDLGISEDLLRKNLMFTTDKAGEHITSSLPPADGEKIFGRAPPDLSLTARERGPDWIYSYLLTFYLDPSRPTGANNVVLPGAAMPHVLGSLQGWQELEKPAEGEHEAHHKPKFTVVQKGALSEEEYEELVGDLTNFLVYAAEPGRNHRMAVGVGALAFVVLFGILAYLLKVEYWKDVH